jgi:hypothetical protein
MDTLPPPLTFEITLEQRLVLSKIELEAPHNTKEQLIEAIKSLTLQTIVLQNNLSNVIRPSRPISASLPSDLETVRANPAYRELFNRDI